MKLHVALLTLAGVLMAGAVVAVAVESGGKKQPAVVVRDLPGGRHETCKQMADGGMEECHPVEALPQK